MEYIQLLEIKEKYKQAISWPGIIKTLKWDFYKKNWNMLATNIVFLSKQTTMSTAIMTKLCYINKCFHKLLCGVFVAVYDLEWFWVGKLLGCRSCARLVRAQLHSHRFCGKFPVGELIKEMGEMFACMQYKMAKSW